MGAFTENFGNYDFSKYHGSPVPVMPNTFPNNPTFESPGYGNLFFKQTDLADGSTPFARDRLKEIGINFVEGATKVLYGALSRKADSIPARNVPTDGFPVSTTPSQNVGGVFEGLEAKAGLNTAQMIFIGAVGILLLIGIAKA